MPFFGKKINKGTSLRIGNTLPSSNRQRRVSLFRGSITVETAIVLPIFLFAMLSVLMFCEAIRLSDNISVILAQNAKELSMYSYAKKYVGDVPAGRLGNIVFSSTYVKNSTIQGLKKKNQQGDLIAGGYSGIVCLQSKAGENEIIDLIASYQVSLPYSFLGQGEFKCIDRARVRAWTGYDNTQKEGIDAGEEIVYITKDSEVYHRERNCRHLNIKVIQALVSEMREKRNRNGGKYYACNFCGEAKRGVVYLTEYGDKYHASVSCSRLKRDVYPVLRSEVQGRRLCKTCGE